VARTAALLAASRRLVELALDNWDFYGIDLKPAPGVRRLYTISPEHPNDALLAWILRSQPKYQQDPQGRVKVSLQSPPMGELASGAPQMSRTTPHDLDGDGVPETVGAGFDGRIYVLKKTAHGFEVLGSTPSQAYYASNTYGTDWEQIRVARLAGIRSVESAGPNRARVVADVSIDEEVAGEYAGGALEQREVLVSLQPEKGPEIQLEEPFDFSGTSEESLPMRGVLSAPAGVSLARLRFNGRPVWQTPEGMRSKQLKMDLVVPLLPGLNRAQLQALDGAKRVVVREVVIRRNAPVAPLDPARRQALVIGIERYGKPNLPRVAAAEKDAARVRDALVAAGVALAAGVPSLYLGPTRKDLPWFLREADQSYPGQIAVLEGKEPLALADTVALLAERPHQALPAPTRQIDNFIGCLMSGLSEQQYAEGRSHLQAIDQALGPNNYCEGIKVATTNGFDTPKDSLCLDVDMVRSSRNAYFYVYDGQSRPSGMWVELGVALAQGLPCRVLHPSEDSLPPALRGSSLATFHGYADHPSLLANLETALQG